MKKTVKKGIIALFVCALTLSTNAQTLSGIPHTPAVDLLPGPISVSNVTNTGNTATDFFFGELITASVCDGFRPRINIIHGAVNLTATIGTSPVGISDPDIVVFPPELGDVTIWFFVVYEQFGDIIAQDWTYDPIAETLTPGGTVPICEGGCSHPNIDAIDRCGLGIIYERFGEIAGRFGSLGVLCPTASFPSNLNDEVIFSTCTPTGNSEPDISLFHDGVNTMASVVYKHNDGTNESIVLQRHTINDFINANPVACVNNQELISVSMLDESLHSPRIAAVNMDPSGTDPRAPGDCQIVVEHRFGASSGHEILGFNYNESIHGPAITDFVVTNFCMGPMNVQQCLNQKPVVAYTRCDRFIVEWEYYGPCLGSLPQTNGHILVKKMDDAGNIVSSDYEVSNFALDMQAKVPSVCGRFVTMSPPFSSTHVNHDILALMVKGAGTSCMSTSSMPLANLTDPEDINPSDILIYPNPTDETVNIQTPSFNGSYTISDMSGKVLFSGGLKKGEVSVDVSTLSEGTYIVSLFSADSIDHRKLIIR